MSPGEGVDVADCVSWCVQDVEAPVAEVVEGFEAADLDVAVAECHFYYFSIFEVGC